MINEKYQLLTRRKKWSFLEIWINDPIPSEFGCSVTVQLSGEVTGEFILHNITKFSSMVTALGFLNKTLLNLAADGCTIYMPGSNVDELPIYDRIGIM